MNKSYYIIIIFSVFSFMRCTKEKASESILVVEDIPNQFVIGQPELGDMTVHTYSPTLLSTYPLSSSNLSLDIFDDGVNDFHFSFYKDNWNDFSSASIGSANSNIEILSVLALDTLKICVQNLNSLITADTIEFNTYSGFDNSLSVDTVSDIFQTYIPVKLDSNSYNVVNNPDTLWSSYGLFSSTSVGIFYSVPNRYHHIKKGNWKYSDIKYLCFRIFNGSEYKYGWLKLRIIGDFGVEIYEYAIEN